MRRAAVWPGLGTCRIGANRSAQEIANQIALTRRGTDAPGYIHRSMKSLMENRGGVADLLRRTSLAEKAELPPR